VSEVATYALRLGDDALVLSHRLAEWSSSAPELEEDIALTNLALDLLGQARALLSVAGQREDAGRDEDDLAYLRSEREFTNVRLVELQNGDFAHTIIRQLLVATYQLALYAELTASSDPDLAAIAGKAVKEVAYHRDHALKWTLRLGDGTEESHARSQAALDALWPYRHELFERDALIEELVDVGVAADPAVLRAMWEPSVTNVLREATLSPPDDDLHRPTGGRRGRHGEELGPMLAEMQWLHRSHPGVTW
jgi:ring-1,2-phenylacetyl-CoA epoxidase subunit PaaC